MVRLPRSGTPPENFFLWSIFRRWNCVRSPSVLLLSVVLRMRAGRGVVIAARRMGESPGPGPGCGLAELVTRSQSELVLELETVRDLVATTGDSRACRGDTEPVVTRPPLPGPEPWRDRSKLRLGRNLFLPPGTRTLLPPLL